MSPRRCLFVKGGDSCVYSWMILLGSFMIKNISFNSVPLLQWEQEETGSGEGEPEEPDEAQASLAWETDGDMAGPRAGGQP